MLNRMAAFLFVLCIIMPVSAWPEEHGPKVHTSHGLTLYGDLKYGPDFKHFDYVNPDAPKGGTYIYAQFGTFDSLNTHIILGTAPVFIFFHEALMVRSNDEPTSLYGLLAESVTIPEDYSWVEFKLRDIARWHDGRPIAVEDVIFTFEMQKTHGRPEFRNTYKKIDRVEKTGPRSVRFCFIEKGNRRLPHNIAYYLWVLPKHYYEDRDFTKPSLEPALSSTPYKVTKVDPGRSITLERVEDYWGKDLPINRGRHNFDKMRIDYYRDMSISYEAFIAGNVDARMETLPSRWVEGYDIPAVQNGHIKKELFETEGTKAYITIYFNCRLEKFQDPRVREAISYAFDWDWVNKNLYYNLYIKLRSYFDNCELANQGLPSPAELELLEPFRDQLDPRVFTHEFNPPKTDATPALLRKNLRVAHNLLKEAGYIVKDGKLISKTGEQLDIELILWDPSLKRRYASFIENLKRLGISARIRMVDSTENIKRLQNREFDMITWINFPQNLSPGVELRQYFGSVNADQDGGLNYMGVKSSVVDALIEKAIFAPDRAAKVAAVRALDRVLVWGFYSVLAGYSPDWMVAYWDRFGQPDIRPNWFHDVFTMNTWWIDREKDAAVQRARGVIGGKAPN